MPKINLTVKFIGRTAHITLSDGTTWEKKLDKGQTKDQFFAELKNLALEALGGKVKSYTTTTKTEYAQ